MDIYWERQRGGMCRLHALNAFFGERKYDDADFWDAADKFDAEQKNKFGTSTSCRDFDLVNSDQRTLISYILRRHGIYVRHIAINTHRDIIDTAITAGIFFVFNMDHIWIMKNKDNRWYKVDSMSGAHLVNVNQLKHEKNIGIMFPVNNLQSEFNRLADAIMIEIADDPLSFVRRCHNEKNILGNVEVYLGAIADILDIQRSGRLGFTTVNQLIDRYGEFVRKMSLECRYNDLRFLESHVPGILTLVKRLRCI